MCLVRSDFRLNSVKQIRHATLLVLFVLPAVLAVLGFENVGVGVVDEGVGEVMAELEMGEAAERDGVMGEESDGDKMIEATGINPWSSIVE